MEFLIKFLSLFVPPTWTTTSGNRSRQTPPISESRSEFLYRLVQLTPKECAVFLFDGQHFYVAWERAIPFSEMKNISISEEKQLQVSNPAIPHRVVWQHQKIGGGPDLRYNKNLSRLVATKVDVVIELDRPRRLTVYLDDSLHHPKDMKLKFELFQEMVRCSDTEEKFNEFENFFNRTIEIQNAIKGLRVRVSELQKVVTAYETLETDDATKAALFLPQYEHAQKELHESEEQIWMNSKLEMEARLSAQNVIVSIKEDVKRNHKIAVLTAHLTEEI